MKKGRGMVAVALCVVLCAAGCQKAPASSDASSEDEPGPTESQITVEQFPTAPPEPEQDWTPVIDEDGTYHFGIGDQAYTGRLLTDFSAGTVTLETAYGSYRFEDGQIKAFPAGMFADSYNNYAGNELTAADYPSADYIGVRLKNNQPNEVYFGLQGGTAAGTPFIFTGEGADMVLSYNDGHAYAATVSLVSYRYTVTIPAGFEGYLLIPVSRLSVSPDPASPSGWVEAGRPALAQIGFHITGAGNQSVDFRHVFLGQGELPALEKAPDGITNPEYSYTDAQRIVPFWTSNIMYNECLTFEEKDGVIDGTLLFVPKRIISVVDVTHKIEYREGIDYEWVKGTNRIKWLKGSSIPYFYEGALDGLKEPGGSDYVAQGTWDELGRQRLAGVLYCVGSFLYEKQISVTYEYDLAQVKSQGIVYTPYQGDRLPKTLEKLKNGQDLNVLFYGDSVFAGGDASGSYGREPNMPGMDKLVLEYLRTKTKGKVNGKNIAVGGWGYQHGLAALSGTVDLNGAQHNFSGDYAGYDLLFLSFGGNNGTSAPTAVTEGLQQIIQKIKTQSPGIEVVLVTPLKPNAKAAGFTGTKAQFGAAFQALADQQGYALVDAFAIHESLLKYKSFSATSGNNINHPNDWFIRIHAMNMLAAMFDFGA